MIRPHHQISLFGLLVAAACGGGVPRGELPPPAPALAAGDTACLIAAGRPASRDTVTIALTDPVDPAHAPLPRNVAERFVFAQLYETLIRVDCQGRVLPALARSWEQGPEGRWTVTLRSDARFWDGAPVTAQDVLAAWRARDSSLARAVTVPDDRALSIDPTGLSFQRFADPALAVTKPAPGGGWPIGTGHYWTTGSVGGAEALRASPVPGAGLPALRVTVAPASEARDAVDANADLLLTSDAAALDYGRTRSEYQDAPLGWDHTYVLLAPDGSSLELSALRLETLPQAVHVEARPAQGDDGGFWLVDLKRCGLAAEAPSTRAPSRRRIVYEQADRDALPRPHPHRARAHRALPPRRVRAARARGHGRPPHHPVSTARRVARGGDPRGPEPGQRRDRRSARRPEGRDRGGQPVPARRAARDRPRVSPGLRRQCHALHRPGDAANPGR